MWEHTHRHRQIFPNNSFLGTYWNSWGLFLYYKIKTLSPLSKKKMRSNWKVNLSEVFSLDISQIDRSNDPCFLILSTSKDYHKKLSDEMWTNFKIHPILAKKISLVFWHVLHKSFWYSINIKILFFHSMITGFLFLY